jgi:hypothetical protein
MSGGQTRAESDGPEGLAGADSELGRIAEAVKALGLDRDQSIDLLVASITQFWEQRHERSTEPETPAPGGTDDRLICPREVGTHEAAKILGVSKDTVLRYRESGLLPFRNVAPPGSSRSDFRYPLKSILAMRNRYELAEAPAATAPREPPRRPVKGPRQYKHLDLDDD